AVGLGEEIGDLVGEGIARHTLARLGHATEVVDGLNALAGSVEGDLMAARAAHAAALAAKAQEALADVSARFEALGAVLLAAEAAARNLGPDGGHPPPARLREARDLRPHRPARRPRARLLTTAAEGRSDRRPGVGSRYSGAARR